MGFAKKSLGQNFLQSPVIRDIILQTAGDISQKQVLEIGPGLGFLTTKLLAEKCILTAVELDARSIEILKRDFEHKPNFRLIYDDILSISLDDLYPTENYSVIANIPYNITSPLIRKILSRTQNKPEKCILMVQKEVAQKICSSKRSILSISVELFASSRIATFVKSTDFSPAPKVDSAVIELIVRKTPLIPTEMEADFFTVLHAGFSRKRKKIQNYIGAFFGVSSDILLKDIDGEKRAETLTIEEWIHITEQFRLYIAHKKR